MYYRTKWSDLKSLRRDVTHHLLTIFVVHHNMQMLVCPGVGTVG